MIDTHAHLSSKSFDADREEVLGRARAAGVTHIVEVGITPTSSHAAVRLAIAHPEVSAAVGIHPHEAGNHVPDDLEELASHLESGAAVAVGETGLDFYRDYAPHDRQRALFEAHIELALAVDRPLVVHSRGAEEEIVGMLERLGRGRVRGVLHCYGGPAELVPRITALGFYLGFGGAVTRSPGRHRRLLPAIPHERLLLETDCPYLAPAPETSRRNEPAFLREALPMMASMIGIEAGELESLSDENARRAFGLSR